MLPRLIALTGLFAVLLLAGVVAGTSRAQETGSLTISTIEGSSTVTVGGSTITMPPDITVPIPTHPPPDMNFSLFRERSWIKLRRIQHFKIANCRWNSSPTSFHRPRNEIKPWRRADNLHHLNLRVLRVKLQRNLCPQPGVYQTNLSIRWAKHYVTIRMGTAQWNCLYPLWGRLESSWRWWADNPGSDAYGIPQALPGSKMGSGWVNDPIAQMLWGLHPGGYVNGGRFSSPCEAYSYRITHGYY